MKKEESFLLSILNNKEFDNNPLLFMGSNLEEERIKELISENINDKKKYIIKNLSIKFLDRYLLDMYKKIKIIEMIFNVSILKWYNMLISGILRCERLECVIYNDLYDILVKNKEIDKLYNKLMLLGMNDIYDKIIDRLLVDYEYVDDINNDKKDNLIERFMYNVNIILRLHKMYKKLGYKYDRSKLYNELSLCYNEMKELGVEEKKYSRLLEIYRIK